jgi:CRISPR-associated protein Cmr2
MAPLSAVMRELRAAESRAKSEGGRDAFSITVMKRSGGALRFTAKWEGHLTLLGDLRAFLTGEAVSRRAVYNSLEWLRDLPEPEGDGAMLETLLAYQFRRQTRKEGAADAADPVGTLARRLTELAMAQPKCRLDWLGKFLTVAEFLAREARGGEAA